MTNLQFEEVHKRLCRYKQSLDWTLMNSSSPSFFVHLNLDSLLKILERNLKKVTLFQWRLTSLNDSFETGGLLRLITTGTGRTARQLLSRAYSPRIWCLRATKNSTLQLLDSLLIHWEFILLFSPQVFRDFQVRPDQIKTKPKSDTFLKLVVESAEVSLKNVFSLNFSSPHDRARQVSSGLDRKKSSIFNFRLKIGWRCQLDSDLTPSVSLGFPRLEIDFIHLLAHSALLNGLGWNENFRI